MLQNIYASTFLSNYAVMNEYVAEQYNAVYTKILFDVFILIF